jgi:uncharacterized tellurite resistance protein B-like protein
MLKRIASMLTGKGDSRNARESGGERIAIAACVLLLEMAHADDFFSPSERGKVREILANNLNFPPDEIEGILAIAERERDDSADLWKYTNLINENFSASEKLRLVDMIWEVAYADGKLDQYEDYLIHKLANLLHIGHQDLIAAKIRAKGMI